MADHIVRQGECLASLARRYGFADWRVIYDAPENAAFRQKRPDPNVILPGDTLFIPERRAKAVDSPDAQAHRFRSKGKTTLLRLKVRDEADQPLAGKPYRLRAGTAEIEGTTDGDGLVEQPIPADAESGELTVWLDGQDRREEASWPLDIGHLDPVEELAGAQARLNNLGFDAGPVDGVDGARTRAAVAEFQDRHGLTVDGICGPQTQAKLKSVHGC